MNEPGSPRRHSRQQHATHHHRRGGPPWRHGPPWHRHGPWRAHARRRRASLRRRLTVAFALVALGAVTLTTWMTLGAVAAVQRDLSPTQGPAVETQAPNGRRDPFGDRDATEALGRISRTAFRAGAVSFVMAVIAAGVFTNVLTRPLKALTRGARRLEAGERGIRLAVPEGRDELGSLTEAFNALVAGLERQEAWRRDMTADIAHDLRTPLAVLRSEIEGMQDGVVPVDSDGLTRLHREVMLLARLIDDLRTLSVSEGGGVSLDTSAVAIEPLLRRSLDAFGSRAAEVGADLRLVSVEPGLMAAIDADRVTQVIGNLLENALRHAGGVVVEVGAEAVRMPAFGDEDADSAVTEQPDDAVRVWVRDHGPGLPADALEQVFERFYRVDDARDRNRAGIGGDGASGSGLGLAIAKAIVEAHGGSIAAFNHPDGGAVFEFTLPISA